MLQEGTKVESFTLQDESGKAISLDDFDGKKKVIYFYPRDDTPGCTTEACGFRDVYDDFLAKDAVVLGISGDTPESHTKFRDKFNLPFHLLADVDKKIIKRFGSWGEKKSGGRTYDGILRTTFVLDEQNVIIKAYPKVKTETHAAEILELLGAK